MLVKVVECTRLWKSNGVLIFTVKHWTELTVGEFPPRSRSDTFKAPSRERYHRNLVSH